MRVVNWERWTKAKLRFASTIFFIGIFLSFGIESSMWWAVPAFVLALTGSVIIKDCYK